MHYTRNLSYFYIWGWGVGVALAPAHKMCCARPCAGILLLAGHSIDLNFLVNIKSNKQVPVYCFSDRFISLKTGKLLSDT